MDCLYLLPIFPGSGRFFLRHPRKLRWRAVLKALTPIMRAYGLRQKDIAWAGLTQTFTDEDLPRLKLAYAGDRTILPDFDLWIIGREDCRPRRIRKVTTKTVRIPT